MKSGTSIYSPDKIRSIAEVEKYEDVWFIDLVGSEVLSISEKTRNGILRIINSKLLMIES